MGLFFLFTKLLLFFPHQINFSIKLFDLPLIQLSLLIYFLLHRTHFFKPEVFLFRTMNSFHFINCIMLFLVLSQRKWSPLFHFFLFSLCKRRSTFLRALIFCAERSFLSLIVWLMNFNLISLSILARWTYWVLFISSNSFFSMSWVFNIFYSFFCWVLSQWIISLSWLLTKRETCSWFFLCWKATRLETLLINLYILPVGFEVVFFLNANLLPLGFGPILPFFMRSTLAESGAVRDLKSSASVDLYS